MEDAATILSVNETSLEVEEVELSELEALDGNEAMTLIDSSDPDDPELVTVTFAESEIFGLGYDVILVALAYTLSISFVTSALRDSVDSLLGEAEGIGRALSNLIHSRNLLPVIIGAVTGPAAWDLIVRMAGYDSIELTAAIFLGICSGALSSGVASLLYRLLLSYKKKLGLIDREEMERLLEMSRKERGANEPNKSAKPKDNEETKAEDES